MKMKETSALLLSALLLAGCSFGEEDSAKGTEEHIEAVISINSEESEVSFEDGLSLLEVMESNFDIIHEDTFITTIEGLEQSSDDNMWWVFEVNEEIISVGASDYIVEDGDFVEWELISF